MIDKNAVPTKLLWVDLEMTGLDPQEDVILEIAAEVTDFDFKTLASYEACVQQPHDLIVERMQKNIWWKDYPETHDEFLRAWVEVKVLRHVEQELADEVVQ